MKSFSLVLKIVLGLAVVFGALLFVVTNYSWVFSKSIHGEVVDVERVTDPTMVMGAGATEAQMYSYSILIKDDDGTLYTASSIDRQWQVVKKGYCVDAVFFRYPPWNFERAGTFYNARLKNVRVCNGQEALPQNTTGPSGPPGAPQPQPQAPAPVPNAK
jgi:hypothetical protein